MNFEIILPSLFFIVVGIIATISFGVYVTYKRTKQELSFEAGVYTGPAGDPYWKGKLPERVDNYSEPRYVYENLVEDTEYHPENGRIIGYRISPTLVTHSRIQDNISPSYFSSYINRYSGKFFTEEDLEALHENWEAISKLRVKAGDTPLKNPMFWVLYQSVPVAYNVLENTCTECIGMRGIYFPLFLKR